MDYDRFDNDSDTSEADYRAFVEWLSEGAVTEFRQARGDAERQKQVLCRYYKRGLRANLTTGELVDFLGVSSRSILDRAGYDEDESDAVMVLSADLTDEEIERVTLRETA